MKLSIGFDGIAIESRPSLEQNELRAHAAVDQITPRDVYVYAHIDPTGQIFYIGMGSGKRAWSRDRERLWIFYVDSHLSGDFKVRILADGLSIYDAERLEGAWIDQENEGLINLQNMGRRLNMEALRHRDELMAQNKALVEQAKEVEKTQPQLAIACYKKALALLKIFAPIEIETGLYGKIHSEYVAVNGPIGQVSLLDRLTLCLIRSGNSQEAHQCSVDYFSLFKSEQGMVAAQKILKRVKRAVDSHPC